MLVSRMIVTLRRNPACYTRARAPFLSPRGSAAALRGNTVRPHHFNYIRPGVRTSLRIATTIQCHAVGEVRYQYDIVSRSHTVSRTEDVNTFTCRVRVGVNRIWQQHHFIVLPASDILSNRSMCSSENESPFVLAIVCLKLLLLEKSSRIAV